MRHTLAIAPDHPAFAGHFPGTPILPGVLLLDEVVHTTTATTDARGWQIVTAKFHNLVRPGERLTLEQERLPDGQVRFWIRSAAQLVASGTLRRTGAPPDARELKHGE